MYIPEATPEALSRALRELAPPPGHVVVALVTGEDDIPLDDLRATLAGEGCSAVGGRFPALIHEGKLRPEGIVLRSLPAMAPPVLVEGLGRDGFRTPRLTDILDRMEDRPYTALILVDGLSEGGGDLLRDLHDQFGNTVNYFGAGTGAASLAPGPSVFTTRACRQDAAAIVFLELDSQLGSGHGWQRVTAPLIATRTEGNVIREINWHPAMDVYRATLAELGEELNPDDVWSLGMRYPLGLCRDRGDDIVRSPLRGTPDGALVCAGDVPENTVMTVLHGSRESLAEAARSAAERVHRPRRSTRCALVVDCIARLKFLENEFPEELALVDRVLCGENAPGPDGVISVGEICSTGDGIVELLNKTIAAGRLHA